MSFPLSQPTPVITHFPDMNNAALALDSPPTPSSAPPFTVAFELPAHMKSAVVESVAHDETSELAPPSPAPSIPPFESQWQLSATSTVDSFLALSQSSATEHTDNADSKAQLDNVMADEEHNNSDPATQSEEAVAAAAVVEPAFEVRLLLTGDSVSSCITIAGLAAPNVEQSTVTEVVDIIAAAPQDEPHPSVPTEGKNAADDDFAVKDAEQSQLIEVDHIAVVTLVDGGDKDEDMQAAPRHSEQTSDDDKGETSVTVEAAPDRVTQSAIEVTAQVKVREVPSVSQSPYSVEVGKLESGAEGHTHMMEEEDEKVEPASSKASNDTVLQSLAHDSTTQTDEQQVNLHAVSEPMGEADAQTITALVERQDKDNAVVEEEAPAEKFAAVAAVVNASNGLDVKTSTEQIFVHDNHDTVSEAVERMKADESAADTAAGSDEDDEVAVEDTDKLPELESASCVMIDIEEAATEEDEGSEQEEDDRAPSFNRTARVVDQPPQRADSPTFGLTQPDSSEAEVSSQQSGSQLHSSQESMADSGQRPSAVTASAAHVVAAEPTATVITSDKESVSIAGVDDERVLSQQLHASQRSNAASTTSDFDITAFILDADGCDEEDDDSQPGETRTHEDDDEEVDEQVKRFAHKEDDVEVAVGKTIGTEEHTEADVDIGHIDEEEEEKEEEADDAEVKEDVDGQDEDEDEVDMEDVEIADEDTASAIHSVPPSPTVLSPLAVSNSPSTSPVFSQSDVDALHSRINELQATVQQLETLLREAEARLHAQDELEDIRRGCMEEAEQETKKVVEDKQRQSSQQQRQVTGLQKQVSQQQQQIQETESTVAALRGDVQRLLLELANEREQSLAAQTDSVEAMRAKEEQLRMLRTEKEDEQVQRVVQLQRLETEIERLTAQLGQREAELAQLLATPLAHRVDGLQQQLQAAQSERDEAMKLRTELESKVKTLKKDGKESRKQWESERRTLETSNKELSSLLQDLALKHSETSTKLSYREDDRKRMDEQIRALEAERKEHQQTDKELTQLRVREELMKKDNDRLYAEKKEAQAEVKSLRDELRTLHDRMREAERTHKEERDSMQRQLESTKATLAAVQEKLSVATERQANTKQQLDVLTRESHKEIKTLKEELRVSNEDRSQLQHTGMQLEHAHETLKTNHKELEIDYGDLDKQCKHFKDRSKVLEQQLLEQQVSSNTHVAHRGTS